MVADLHKVFAGERDRAHGPKEASQSMTSAECLPARPASASAQKSHQIQCLAPPDASNSKARTNWF